MSVCRSERVIERWPEDILRRMMAAAGARRLAAQWSARQAVGRDVVAIGGSPLAAFAAARDGRRVVCVESEAGAWSSFDAMLADEDDEVAARLCLEVGPVSALPGGWSDTVLLHVEDDSDDIADAVSEARRILRPGGTLVVDGGSALPVGKLTGMGIRWDLLEVGAGWIGVVGSSINRAEAERSVLRLVAPDAPQQVPQDASAPYVEAELVALRVRVVEQARKLAEANAQLALEARPAAACFVAGHVAKPRDVADRVASPTSPRFGSRHFSDRGSAVALSDDPDKTFNHGTQLYRRGDNHGAVESFERAVAGGLDSPSLWLSLGRAQRNLGRFDEALDSVARALVLRPGWFNALWPALYLSARLERTADFNAFVDQLGPLDEIEIDDLRRVAQYALRARAFERAMQLGQRLVELDDHDGDGTFTVAAALWELGRDRDADAIIERRLDRIDDMAVIAAIRYDIHRDVFDRLEQLVDRLAAPEAETVLMVAEAFVQRGDVDPAIRLLDRAGELGGPTNRIARLRAVADDIIGVRTRAWTGRRKALEVECVRGRPLHVVSRSLPYHTSGGTYRNHYIAKAQLDAGMTPRVVTELGFPWSQGDRRARPREVLDGVQYFRLPGTGPVDGLSFCERLRRGLKELLPLVTLLRPSVLHPASDFLNAFLALEVRERSGIPVIYEIRGFPEDRHVRRPGSRAFQDRGVARRALEVDAMLRADRIVTLAEVMVDHVVDRGVPREKVVVIPNAVDPRHMRPVRSDRALSRALGIDDADAVLGCVSTFHNYEGIPQMVDALAELRRRGRHVKALIVGDGPDRDKIERTVRADGVADHVVLTGRIAHEQIAAFYGLIDLFLVPRRDETTSALVTPLKPFEAMAMGLCVIVSRTPALCEVVRDGETGRTFTPDDPADLADVCEALIDDPSERRRLADNGREWVLRERTWQRNAELYRALYQDLGAL